VSERIRVLELRSVRGTGGGPEKTILHGAALANRERFDVTVCYIRDRRDAIFGIDQRARDLAIDYVEVRERHSFDPRIWPQLVRTVRDRRIDIVHAHDYKTNVLALALRRATRAIPLSTAHGYTGNSPRERHVYYPLDKQVLRWFPRVIAVSGELRSTLTAAGVRAERVTTVLNGIDPSAFHRDRRAEAPVRGELGVAASEYSIGAVGRLEHQKRFDLLLETVARLRAGGRAVTLSIVGDGSLRAMLEAKIRHLRLDAACRLLGHRADIGRLHHGFDLFVQSSDYEGTPNAVLEAMALETPIVATDAGGTRDILRHGIDGLIVPCGDALVLSNAIERCLLDPARAASRAVSARHRIERQLSFERRTRTVEGIYEHLVAHAGSYQPVALMSRS
jgi:glycosyltransferase involved in cell wall biosynthesis